MARKNSFFKLDMLLLCIIAKQDCYGYEITKQIKTYSHELIDIKEGTMYPILYKLQDENYISSYEKVIERKVRNVFTITNYDGLDPEVGDGNDNNLYPRPFSVVLRLSLNF